MMSKEHVSICTLADQNQIRRLFNHYDATFDLRTKAANWRIIEIFCALGASTRKRDDALPTTSFVLGNNLCLHSFNRLEIFLYRLCHGHAIFGGLVCLAFLQNIVPISAYDI